MDYSQQFALSGLPCYCPNSVRRYAFKQVVIRYPRPRNSRLSSCNYVFVRGEPLVTNFGTHDDLEEPGLGLILDPKGQRSRSHRWKVSVCQNRCP